LTKPKIPYKHKFEIHAYLPIEEEIEIEERKEEMNITKEKKLHIDVLHFN